LSRPFSHRYTPTYTDEFNNSLRLKEKNSPPASLEARRTQSFRHTDLHGDSIGEVYRFSVQRSGFSEIFIRRSMLDVQCSTFREPYPCSKNRFIVSGLSFVVIGIKNNSKFKILNS
jgi:hypothetical protein